MDGIAIFATLVFGLFCIIFFSDDGICSKQGWVFVGIIIIFNLVWFPILFSEYKTTTNTFITTQYRGLQFSEPVKVIENRKYKKMSVFFDETAVEIKVIHSNK